MKDFDRWFADAGAQTKASTPTVAPKLPEGVFENEDGDLCVLCCCCYEVFALPVDLSEVPAKGYRYYCGGAPSCSPGWIFI